MEKFRKFSDPQTGINLFLPAFANHGTSIFSRLFHITFGLILLVIRLPLILLLLLFAFVLNSVAPSKALNSLIFRSVLFLFGFYSIDNQVPVEEEPNSLIVSNHSSPIDWIFFLYHCSPRFTQMIDKSGQVTFQPLSFASVLKKLFTINQPLTSGNGHTLDDILDPNRPTLVFFEGTHTNQNGVLEPCRNLVLQLQALQPQIYIYVLTYSDKSLFTPINTTRNGLWHFLIMLTSVSNSLRVTCQDFDRHSDYLKLMRNVYESEGFRMIEQPWTVSLELREYYQQTAKGNYLKTD